MAQKAIGVVIRATHGRPASQLGKLMAAVESEFRTDVLKLGADELRPCCDVPVEHQPVLARCVAEAAQGQSVPTG